MRRFAHFTLEGLFQQGPHRVWIPLGTFATAELAASAVRDGSGMRPGVVETRIIPLYRDCEPTPRSARGRLTAAHVGESVTVA